jgi:hypothetical protein
VSTVQSRDSGHESHLYWEITHLFAVTALTLPQTIASGVVLWAWQHTEIAAVSMAAPPMRETMGSARMATRRPACRISGSVVGGMGARTHQQVVLFEVFADSRALGVYLFTDEGDVG